MKKFFLGLTFVVYATFAFSQNEVLDNNSILDMIETGFSNDVIVAKINTSQTNFDTSIHALKTIKGKGASNDIIVAMMQQIKKGNSKKTSGKTGIYLKENNEFKKIFPIPVSSKKTNTLGSNTTPYISNTKIKAVLMSERSINIANTNIPEFYFYFDKESPNTSNWWFATASSPREFILVTLESKKDKRVLKTGEIDIYSGNFIGVENKDITEFNIEAISENEFRVTPKEPLTHGEYCFFYQGTTPLIYNEHIAVFDFSIPEGCKLENKYKIDDSVWISKDGKPKKLEVMSVNIKNDGVYYSLRPRNSWKDEEYKESECHPSKEEAMSKTNTR